MDISENVNEIVVELSHQGQSLIHINKDTSLICWAVSIIAALVAAHVFHHWWGERNFVIQWECIQTATVLRCRPTVARKGERWFASQAMRRKEKEWKKSL